jgi:hypothetical protein
LLIPLQGNSEGPKDQETEPKKEGIEKIDLPPRFEYETGQDGKVIEKKIPQWEIRAHGKKYVQELRGIFKESAPQMAHEQWLEWNKIGDEKITRPDGSVDTVRADKVDMYRQHPGFCVTATRPVFEVDGFGGMKREGISRMRIRYSNGTRTIEEVKYIGDSG